MCIRDSPTLVRKILHLLTDARRPLILAGAGVLRARSTDALVRFAETVRVPVVASWRRADVDSTAPEPSLARRPDRWASPCRRQSAQSWHDPADWPWPWLATVALP